MNKKRRFHFQKFKEDVIQEACFWVAFIISIIMALLLFYLIVCLYLAIRNSYGEFIGAITLVVFAVLLLIGVSVWYIIKHYYY